MVGTGDDDASGSWTLRDVDIEVSRVEYPAPTSRLFKAVGTTARLNPSMPKLQPGTASSVVFRFRLGEDDDDA